MKIKLAGWYMETVWPHMGNLRNVPYFHKLFNRAFGARREEYVAMIAAQPVSNYQTERGVYIRLMLQLQGVI